jgi:hypothetical protein
MFLNPKAGPYGRRKRIYENGLKKDWAGAPVPVPKFDFRWPRIVTKITLDFRSESDVTKIDLAVHMNH